MNAIDQWTIQAELKRCPQFSNFYSLCGVWMIDMRVSIFALVHVSTNIFNLCSMFGDADETH